MKLVNVKNSILSDDLFLVSRSGRYSNVVDGIDTTEINDLNPNYHITGDDLEDFVIAQQGDVLDNIELEINRLTGIYDDRIKDLVDMRTQEEERYKENLTIQNNQERLERVNYAGLSENTQRIRDVLHTTRMTKTYLMFDESQSESLIGVGTGQFITGGSTSSGIKFSDVKTIKLCARDMANTATNFWALMRGDVIEVVCKQIVAEENYVEEILQRGIFQVSQDWNVFDNENIQANPDDTVQFDIPVDYYGGSTDDIILSSDIIPLENQRKKENYPFYNINIVPSLTLSHIERIKDLDNKLDQLMPVGSIIMYYGNSIPAEYGVWEKRTDLAGLFPIGADGETYQLKSIYNYSRTGKPQNFDINSNGTHAHSATINYGGGHTHSIGGTAYAGDSVGKTVYSARGKQFYSDSLSSGKNVTLTDTNHTFQTSKGQKEGTNGKYNDHGKWFFEDTYYNGTKYDSFYSDEKGWWNKDAYQRRNLQEERTVWRKDNFDDHNHSIDVKYGSKNSNGSINSSSDYLHTHSISGWDSKTMMPAFAINFFEKKAPSPIHQEIKDKVSNLY